MEAASQLPSPFGLRHWPDQDVDFVLHALAVWQQHLAYSVQCRRVLCQVRMAYSQWKRQCQLSELSYDGIFDSTATVA